MFEFLAKLFSKQKQFYSSRGFSAGGTVPSDWTAEDMLAAYGNVGWWHAVVFRIALGMSEVQWTLFDASNPQKPKQQFKHPVLDLLHLCNPFQTSEELIALDTIYMECLGESFWVLNNNANGEPAEIILPYPTLMQVIPDKNFPFVKGYIYGQPPNQIPLDANQVIHFKYPNPLNQFRGLGQASAIGVNLSAEKNADKWVDQFFYNSARPDGVIQFDYSLSDEQFDKLKKQWSEKYRGVNKAHQVALLEGGGKYVQIQNAVKDMDFPNLKQKNRDIILGIEGMPLSIMGISTDVNKANAEAGDYTFARWVLKPRLDWKKAKLQEQLIPKFKNSQNLKLGFEEIVPETAEQKRLDAESGMRAGYLTVNEARVATGKDPLPGDVGDVLLIPLNLIPTPISRQPQPPEKPPEKPAEQMSFKSPDRQALRERFALRIARQEEAFKQVFSSIFDGQRDAVVGIFERVHQLPDTLNDEETGRRFEPAIRLVYESGFDDALPKKQEDVLDERALEWIATRSLTLAKSINKTTLEALRAELQAGFAAGESIQQITNRIAGYFDETKKWKAEQVARSEVVAAGNEGALQRYGQAGVEKAIFTTAAFNVCEVCDALDGKEYPVDEAHDVIPVHPNCLLPDIRVETPHIVSGSRAFYNGQAIELTTQNGYRLTITPNHMILTPAGFVKSKFLHEGDYIISSPNSKRMIQSVNPNYDQSPVFVADIWDSLLMTPGMSKATMPISPVDFYGDAGGFDGNIDIIYPDGFLLSNVGNSTITQHINKDTLSNGYSQLFPFNRQGMTQFSSSAMMTSLYSNVSFTDSSHSLFGSHLGHRNNVGFAPIAGYNTSLQESFTDNIPAYTELSREFQFRFSSFIAFEQIVKVRYFNYVGHVYDLQTLEGLYIANSIAVKNCRCTFLAAI